MVYCGKPSRGCLCCKKRRIKCDEARPACSQCQKSARVCPGYVDEFDLILRNETDSTRRKARKSASGESSRIRRNGSSSSPSETSPSSSGSPSDSSGSLSGSSSASSTVTATQNQIVTPILPILTNPTPSEADTAVSFFFGNFITPPRYRHDLLGCVAYLLPMYVNSSVDSALFRTTRALALYTMSYCPGWRHLTHKGNLEYGQAIRELRAAVQDPTAAKSDETLMAIILASLYESISLNCGFNWSWSCHIEGAATLTKLRGQDNFSNPRSLSIFRAVRDDLVTKCIQYATPMVEFPGPNGWSSDPDDDGNLEASLGRIAVQLPSIRARTKSLITSRFSSADAMQALPLIQEAAEIDSKLTAWAASLPPICGYKTIYQPQSLSEDISTAGSWPGPLHIYEDVYLAGLQNHYRLLRISCQDVIMACSRWLDQKLGKSGNDSQLLFAQALLQQMVDDICASVPFHLDHNVEQRAREIGQDVRAAVAIGGFIITLPLVVCSGKSCVPKRQRDWMEYRLAHIARSYGLTKEQLIQPFLRDWGSDLSTLIQPEQQD